MAAPLTLTFLGTSAANAYPEPFCQCANCVRARALGGPSLRKRSAALVNDDLLIDLGPDLPVASQQHGIALTGVRFCLQTHPHADHLDASHLLSRTADYGTRGAPPLVFCASPPTLDRLAWALARDFAPASALDARSAAWLDVTWRAIQPYQPFTLGDYTITAFPANHDPAMGSLLYAISRGGRTLFYGTDTGALGEEVWAAFARLGARFDVVVLDHTYGPEQVGGDHLSARDVIAHAARMRAMGVLGAQGRVFGTHIAHEGNPPHPELSAWADAHGYAIACDGLRIDV
ncbi:MAG: hypothetical protein K1X39_10600 [Thermoflexales bacterium]|nr:hypothetical protein [Thermoflexales bacterium]